MREPARPAAGGYASKGTGGSFRVLEAFDVSMTRVWCGVHLHREAWITCVHVGEIRRARKLSPKASKESGFVGEALCEDCAGKDEPPVELLRLACGDCVRSRWPIEGSN